MVFFVRWSARGFVVMISLIDQSYYHTDFIDVVISSPFIYVINLWGDVSHKISILF